MGKERSDADNGDIAPLRGRGPWHVNDQKKWINKRFREWTASFPDIQFVVILGNHGLFESGCNKG